MRVFFYPPFIPPYIPPPVYKYYFLQKFNNVEMMKHHPYFQTSADSYVLGGYSSQGTLTPTGPTSPANVRLR
jgi:hypothetical protein